MNYINVRIPALFFSFTLILLINISCKNASSSKLEYNDQETVKDEVKNFENELTWTKTIDEEILANSLKTDDKYTKSKLTINPDLFKINKNNNTAIYPELKNFASLDTSILNKAVKLKINKFLNALNSDIYSGPEVYFESKFIFNYIFFRNDLIQGWKNNFNTDFPYSEADYKESREIKDRNSKIIKQKQEIEERKKIAKENGEDITEEIKNIKLDKLEDEKELKIFEKWIMGQAFIGPDITSIPIRFYCKDGTIDVTLYISNSEKNEFYQITIDTWSKKV